AAGINPDPAWDYKGLLWDYRRIGLPQGWKTTAGSSKVTVGVADTGLDYTHSELAPRVKRVIDFTGLEEEPPCGDVGDDDLAKQFGRPAAHAEATPWPTSAAARPTPAATATAAGSAAASPPPSTARASTGSLPG